MIQTLALLHDAYRELNAKRLFWFTLMLSGLVVAIFAMIGNNERGLTVLTWTLELPLLSTKFIPAEEFHKLFFVNLGLGVWLTWIAMILALVSTASIFPDFLAGGAIELTLSKPIGRLRLFLTKYVAALLFVGLQVGVFTLASFLVIGFRGGGWIPAIFLAVPIVVLVFSYLFSICVLIGTLWRSTIAALMLTLLAWGLIFMVNTAELGMLTVTTGMTERDARLSERIEALRNSITQESQKPETADAASGAEPEAVERPREGGLLAGLKWAAGRTQQAETSRESRLQAQRDRLTRLETRLKESQVTTGKLRWWHGMIFGMKSALPKTAETTSIMERYVLDLGKLKQLQAAGNNEPQVTIDDGTDDETPRVEDRLIGERVQEILRSRTEWWIIGTSLAFECCVLGLSAWIFCRRDF
ncbi:MAG: ABC transporter permease [Phycisphaerae bacterium]|nr:ABC transporter permease [Phycisphaerae bacterium]